MVSILTATAGEDVEDSVDTSNTATERQYRFSSSSAAVSLVTIWLACLSIALLVVMSKYSSMSVVAISSSMDKLDEKNNEIHEDTLDMIHTVDSKYRDTLLKLRRTVDDVSELEGQVEDSLRELNFFFLGMGKVAADASKEFEEFRI